MPSQIQCRGANCIDKHFSSRIYLASQQVPIVWMYGNLPVSFRNVGRQGGSKLSHFYVLGLPQSAPFPGLWVGFLYSHIVHAYRQTQYRHLQDLLFKRRHSRDVPAPHTSRLESRGSCCDARRHFLFGRYNADSLGIIFPGPTRTP